MNLLSTPTHTNLDLFSETTNDRMSMSINVKILNNLIPRGKTLVCNAITSTSVIVELIIVEDDERLQNKISKDAYLKILQYSKTEEDKNKTTSQNQGKSNYKYNIYNINS